MKKPLINAISFLYKGERVKISVNRIGKFKIPVSETVQGKLVTRNKSLTAREAVGHYIIKDCDPTLYTSSGERVRVYQGGIAGYLPAAVDGIISKHDSIYSNKGAPNVLNKKKSSTSEKSESSWNSWSLYDGLGGYGGF